MACKHCGQKKSEHHEYEAETPVEAKIVLDYWKAKAGVEPRAPRVIQAIERRLTARLRDGFSPEQLMACVDVALQDRFYVENRYFANPEIIWRNAERVQSLLTKRIEAPAPEPEARAASSAMAWINAHGGVLAVRAQIRESGKRTAVWLTDQGAPPFVLAAIGHS